MLIDSYTQFLRALCLWREAANQTKEARLAVLWVMQNRVGNPLFKPTLMRVIVQPAAFSSMTNHGDAETVKWPVDAPTTQADWQAFKACCAMVDEELTGVDPSGGAVYYESYPVEKLEAIREQMPWFAASKMTAQIGAFRFYAA